jgi:hypothetical protein
MCRRHIERAVHLTERLNTLFAIVIARIDRLDDFRILENQRGLQKIDSSNFPVFLPLALSSHENSIA